MARRLAAILAADVVGYTRLMGADEVGTLDRLKSLRKELVQPRIISGDGRIVKLTGDGLLAEFPSVVEAVHCAVDIQEQMIDREADLPDEKRIRLRIGVNLGDIIAEGSDIYGDGVNVAARLESLAEPGGICISSDVFRYAKGKIKAEFEDIGEQDLKNVPEPVRVYRIVTFGFGPPAGERRKESILLPDKPSIAVLPFVNMSGDPEQEYFADGVAEDIITALSRTADLLVIARTSSFSYRGRSVDIRSVGQELGVRYVLEGSIRRSGDRIRITAQLIEAKTGSHIWAENYDRPITDLFEVQDEITVNVAGAVGSEVRTAEIRRAIRRSRENLDSWERLMKAYWHFHKENPDDNAIAQAICNKEIEETGGNSTCFALLGFCYTFEAFYWSSEDFAISIDKAAVAGENAVRLDHRNELAHSLLSMVYRIRGDKSRALHEAELAVANNPNDTAAHSALGYALASMGLKYHSRAKEHLELSLRLGPSDIWSCWNHAELGLIYLIKRQYQDAITHSRLALDHNPTHGMSLRIMASALALAGRIEEAKETWKRAQQANPLDMPGYVQRLRQQYENPEDVISFIEGMKLAGAKI